MGPAVTPATFAEAERLVRVRLTDAQRRMAADSWRTGMAGPGVAAGRPAAFA